jgi:hypothetical protein
MPLFFALNNLEDMSEVLRYVKNAYVAHISLEELEKALENRIHGIDVTTLARKTIARMRGRV